LRIGINTLVVLPGEIGGTQTYLRELIENLAKIDRKNEYLLFVAPWNKKLFRVKQKNFKKIICNIPSKSLFLRVLYEQVVFPLKAWRNNLDVIHFPASVSSLFFFSPSVLTLHDLTPLIYPGFVPSVLRYYWKLTYKLSARRANFIIAVSHTVKKDIIKLLDIDPEKIEVVYHGNNPWIQKTKDKGGRVFDAQNNKSSFPYILWVGKIYTHKNLTRLLYAYNKLIKTKNIKHRLILCGMKGWGYSSFLKVLQELNLQDKVIFKGYVADNELKLIYTNASLFAFPSLSEGFGLPILEAMSCGTPVVTSNYGAMAEIAGDAALLVNPYNINEIAEAMYSVLTDENLRKDLIRKGLKRVKEFSWKKTARETLEVYKRVHKRKI